MLQRRGFPRVQKGLARRGHRVPSKRGASRVLERHSWRKRHVASATSASRSHENAATGNAGASPATQPTADITAITTRDDFLLELGQTLGGQAAVRPVDTLEGALESIARGKRAQVLVIDAREVANVRAAVDAAHAAAARVVVLVFA